MLHHVLEILVWLLLAFIVGALFGCVLRKLLTGGRGETVGRTGTTGGTMAAGLGAAGAATMGASAARKEKPEAEGAVKREAPAAVTKEKKAEEAKEAPSTAQGLMSASESAASATPAREAGAKADEAKKAAAGDDAKETPATAQGLMGAPESAPRAEAGDKAEAAAEAGGGSDDKWKVPVVGLKEPVAGEPDNLEMISGIGPKLASMLHEMGIYYFAQIARWTDEIIEEVDDKLRFKGRIKRDEWVRQAKLLAEGKMEQFEREYGTGGLKDKSGKTQSGTRTRRSVKKTKD